MKKNHHCNMSLIRLIMVSQLFHSVRYSTFTWFVFFDRHVKVSVNRGTFSCYVFIRISKKSPSYSSFIISEWRMETQADKICSLAGSSHVKKTGLNSRSSSICTKDKLTTSVWMKLIDNWLHRDILHNEISESLQQITVGYCYQSFSSNGEFCVRRV